MTREEKERPLAASPKKRFDPLKNCDLKPLSIKEAINNVSPQSILHTAVPKPKEVFVRELITTKLFNLKMCLVYLMSLICRDLSDFKKNLRLY